MPRIVLCRQEHREAVLELLSDAGLPAEGVLERPGAVWVAQAGAEVVGAVGLEGHGDSALLRSLVVRADRRRGGLGAALVRRAIREAGRMGARQIWLLTAGAGEFFKRYGFEPVAAQQAPAAVRGSPGFRAAPAGKPVCMRLRIGAG